MIWPFTSQEQPQELIAKLSDPDPAVRQAAFNQLEEHEDPNTDTLIASALREAVFSESEALLPLVMLCGKRDIEESIEDLASLLNSENSQVRHAAVQALINIPSQSALEKLIPLLTDPDLTIRRQVHEAIVNLFGQKAMGALIRAIPEDRNSNLYFEIVSLFEELGLFAVLREQFQHPDPEVKRFHFDTLVRFHRPDFVSLFLEMRNDPDPAIRKRLRDTLMEYTADELLPAFREQLLDSFDMTLLQLTDDLLIKRFPEARRDLLEFALEMPPGHECEMLLSRLLKRLDPVLFAPALKFLDVDSTKIRSMVVDALIELYDSVKSKTASGEGAECSEKLSESWCRLLCERILVQETIRPETIKLFFYLAQEHPELARPVLSKLLSKAFADTVKAISSWPFEKAAELVRMSMQEDPSIGVLLLSGYNKFSSPFLLRILLKNASVLDPDDKAAFFKKQLGSAAISANLVKFLEDKDPEVRAFALELLGEANVANLPKIVEERVHDIAPVVRLAALRVAVKRRHPRLTELLEELLSDPAPEVAVEALSNLKEILPPERLSSILAPLVHSPNPELREMALTETAKAAQKKYIENFSKLSPEVRKLAGTALLKLNSQFLDRLIEELQSLDPELRLRAARILENLQVGDKAKQALLKAMKDPSRKVRAAVAKTLGVIGDRELFGNLIELINDSDERVRANAIEAIASMGDSQALQILFPFLDDPNNRIRANAAIAVWRIGNIDVVPVLQKMLATNNRLMQASALWALGEIRNPNNLPIILAHLRDNDEMVRLNAVRAAIKISPEALKPFISDLRKDTSAEIRSIVAELSYKVM